MPNGSSGSDAENRSRWKQSFTNVSFMESVNGGSGRRLDGHAMQIIGSLLATSRLSTVQLPSMAGVGATQAIRQAILAAWKAAGD
jgi:hypothetical protein